MNRSLWNSGGRILFGCNSRDPLVGNPIYNEVTTIYPASWVHPSPALMGFAGFIFPLAFLWPSKLTLKAFYQGLFPLLRKDLHTINKKQQKWSEKWWQPQSQRYSVHSWFQVVTVDLTSRFSTHSRENVLKNLKFSSVVFTKVECINLHINQHTQRVFIHHAVFLCKCRVEVQCGTLRRSSLSCSG